MNVPDENAWVSAVRANPDHAKNYAQRWRNLVDQGQDIFGEARTVDAMAARGSRILDAGCGTGRIGGWLSSQGHEVVGVDLDPDLIDVARTDYPEAQWIVGNLASFSLEATSSGPHEFDLIVSAGNVLTFLSLSERLPALKNLHDLLAQDGRMIVGFGASRGYGFDVFENDAAQAGLEIQQRFSSWDLRLPSEDFLVAILGRNDDEKELA
ncbi:class I SAM-dependent methyltransferase [Glutamicibacter sp.]|uniref:class I SAM-dependent methyltransferase n=1 Tax=Glutamicibacter sp. TaxID=1931995 RepID=UPI002FE3B32E